jgi:anthranilate synthase component 1
MPYQFQTKIIKTLSDTYTPVQVYYKIRDKFPNSLLLESSDYKSKENSYSYICLNPIASFVAHQDITTITYPNQVKLCDTKDLSIVDELENFIAQFDAPKQEYDFITNGLFGYTSYDAIPLFEDIEFKAASNEIPLIHYQIFQNLIVFDHYYNTLYLIEHTLQGQNSTISNILDLISNRSAFIFPFSIESETTSNFTDDEFLSLIQKGKEHCFKGDVFQVVFSRKFKQKFKGDEFIVYRALRAVNPSPYLFYFDYGNFKIFGSSPEAQLTIKDNKAYINPIAGTFKRTGNMELDEALSIKLSEDPKENAEHIMLVDLARNDLSKNSSNVTVESLKKIEYYSHVIHLVSKVSATLPSHYNPIQLLGDTYPAGTLSGSPKHEAMKLIDKYEKENRGFYGGTVGYIGLDKSFNHAIFIRSFFSQNNCLEYQAGCGIVAKSNPQSELEEVNNKVSALQKAITFAKTL